MLYSLNRAVNDGIPRVLVNNKTNDDLMKNLDPNIIDVWFQMERDGHPRYRYTEKYKLIHEHDDEIKKNLLRDNKSTKGHNICKYLGVKIPHNVLNDVRQPDGSTMAI